MTFVDASADESKLLLFAGSDNDPGRYYLYDKKTHSMGEILPDRAELVGIALSTVKAITYQAADGTTIPAYLTLLQGATARTYLRSSCRMADRRRATNGGSIGCRNISPRAASP